MENKNELLLTVSDLKEKLIQAVSEIGNKQSIAFKTIDDNFEDLNKRISSIEKKLASLSDDTSKNFDDVKVELKKISTVTGYKDQFENLIDSSKIGEA